MEENEGELLEVAGVVKILVPKLLNDGQDKDAFGPVGVKYLEKVDGCLLADPFVVSGLVLGAVESVTVTRSGLVGNCCVSSDQW